MDFDGRRHRAPARRRTRTVVLAAVGVLAVAVTVGVWVAGPGTGPTAVPSAAAGPAPRPTTTLVAPPAPPTTSTTAPLPPSRARAAVDAADAAAGRRSAADVGVAVLDLATGEVVTNDKGDMTFNAASLTKLLTVTDILERRRTGRADVDGGDLTRIRSALALSDDNAMNALWSGFGGPAGITRVVDRFALADTSAPEDTSQWGQMQTSPRDMVQVFRGVLQDLPPADRDLMLSDMRAAPSEAADGFDQGFGLLDPDTRGSAIAKQGWLCCLSASVDLHSVGLLDDGGRYVVALLSNQPLGYAAARTVLDDAARAARTAAAA